MRYAAPITKEELAKKIIEAHTDSALILKEIEGHIVLKKDYAKSVTQKSITPKSTIKKPIKKIKLTYPAGF